LWLVARIPSGELLPESLFRNHFFRLPAEIQSDYQAVTSLDFTPVRICFAATTALSLPKAMWRGRWFMPQDIRNKILFGSEPAL
jgi:hypothetical protein